MRYDLIIFDLDGTVLNTLIDLTCAVNYALKASGFPELDREGVRHRIGNGVARLIRLALPEGTPESVQSRVLADFKAYYAEHADVHTLPYPGIPELLQALRSAGVATAVNSNKMDVATQSLCRAHFDGLLDAVLGERAEIPKKPAPDGAKRVMADLNAPAARTLYVGDSDTDLLTAQNAGIDGAWVAWGYRRREELGDVAVPHAFETVEALKAFILE